jgi:hypothetical protein
VATAKVCPPPPDCPLYNQRLEYGPDEPLRRAILTERPRPSLGALVWADFNRQYRRPGSDRAQPQTAALPPAVEQPHLPIFEQTKGAIT